MESLKKEKYLYHIVRRGQTLKEIAEFFCVGERALILENQLTQPPQAGQILAIPQESGDIYTVHIGENKALLCGSEEAYERKNGTKIIYPGMRVIL